ncbi:DNA polymerase III subunit gamma/tau [Mangrovimicrobium sediminis]|uniref:DNA polymerase III subunit gamma/tau n=1 Tax=Mangrovimicrobium sediminis TaxID=2562682 RepID=A0A4Z0M2A6_9GAMM|nr:DNA polymerase III subunit gamma/tau [Haliea sp. SAOS-164]TGD73567.1 DNA polymerase III subunit gamma/tau [Haliea sp. SAOS-164]
MSYQVLARKWRPKSFREMVGQEHVLRALINALDHDRLHHAYLFTGTRGVGKTTIARILAKCLNCEQGVSSEPCGECGSCLEIAEGRSVDLLEVDAASRTKVEDTRELLENVQYAPTRSRYKIYLIDEVHMLSTSSFNALLKTLEEPPPHVKFLLATTDPQKLPATVLSRCLQFNLKNMPPEQIVGHLESILGQEMISFETPALWLLGRAAAGSMRDALSLTDQAIAFGSGKLTEAEVRSMLGSVDLGFIYELLEEVAGGDAASVLAVVARMGEHGADFDNSAEELISLLHRIAVAQVVPDAVDNTWGDAERVAALAAAITAEDAQLYYQVAINGKRDMALAPEPRVGFEMSLLRMLAFRPAQETAAPAGGSPGGAATRAGEVAADAKKSPEASRLNPRPAPSPAQALAKPAPAGERVEARVQERTEARVEAPAAQRREPPPATAPSVPPGPAAPAPGAASEPAREQPAASGAAAAKADSGDWITLVEALGLVGVVQSIAHNMALVSAEHDRFQFVLDAENAALFNPSHEDKLRLALQNYLEREVSVSIEVGDPPVETPAMRRARLKQARRQQAVTEIENDERLRALMARFDGKLDVGSIAPREP